MPTLTHSYPHLIYTTGCIKKSKTIILKLLSIPQFCSWNVIFDVYGLLEFLYYGKYKNFWTRRASYIWIFVRETLANQVYVVATEELWYLKSSLLRSKLWHRQFKVYGVLYEKMRFSTNNSKAEIPWKFHGTLMGVKMNS
jgi:hypothetical protein